jgi:hypothetical protein
MQSEDYKPTAQSQKASRASQSIPSVSKVFKNVDEPDPEGNLYDTYGAEGDINRSSEGNNSGSLNNSSAKVKINNINSSSQAAVRSKEAEKNKPRHQEGNDGASGVSEEENRFDGVVYKLKSGMLGRFSWVQKFVFTDGERFVQWNSEREPLNYDVKPSYYFELKDCVVESFNDSLQGKKLAFKIIDKKQNASCVYACENLDDYTSLLGFITKTTSKAPEDQGIGKSKVPRGAIDEDFNHIVKAKYPGSTTYRYIWV